MLTQNDWKVMYEAQESDMVKLCAELGAANARADKAEKEVELLLWADGKKGQQIIEFGDEINERGRQLSELATDNARLRAALGNLTEEVAVGSDPDTGNVELKPGIHHKAFVDGCAALAATAPQSLAKVQAAALRDAAKEIEESIRRVAPPSMYWGGHEHGFASCIAEMRCIADRLEAGDETHDAH